MTEGLLYHYNKLLLEVNEDIQKKKYLTVEGKIIIELINAVIESVNIKLDEAKQEYPKHKQIYIDAPETLENWKIVAKVMEQKNIERGQWFEKWFGEAKE